MTDLTQKRLKELLHYDPETGLFNHRGYILGSRANPKHYICVALDDKTYYAHRLAFLYMTGKWPVNTADHINRIKTDNRWANLRDATALEQQEFHLKSKGSSGLAGVRLNASGKRWNVNIKYRGQTFFMGSFLVKDKHLAINARKSAEACFRG